VITADKALGDVEEQQYGKVWKYAHSGPKPNLKRLEASYANWRNYDASIRIMASPGVKKAFKSQKTDHRRFVESYGRVLYAVGHLRDPKTPAKHRKYYEEKVRIGLEKMPLRMKELSVHRDSFVLGACVDMGNPQDKC
jgi:hypothetical protein